MKNTIKTLPNINSAHQINININLKKIKKTKVEHITIDSSRHIIHDIKDIIPQNVGHFKMFQNVNYVESKINHTNLKCVSYFDKDIAIFTLFSVSSKKEIPLTVNLCCFNVKDKRKALKKARIIADTIPCLSHFIININPVLGKFLITFILPTGIFSSPKNLLKADEIKLYIYDALRSGLNK
ncbi:MAG: hypothetical protein ACOYO1_19090 [Bacteroidales bacterium]